MDIDTAIQIPENVEHRHRATSMRRSNSHTLPSSPTHSSSSSEFEFAVSLSPHKSPSALRPADELFYKGQLLPLHPSPTLLRASSSSSSLDTSASRDSSASRSSCDTFADENLKPLQFQGAFAPPPATSRSVRTPKQFSLSKFTSVFRTGNSSAANSSRSAAKSGAKDVIRKYLKKVKPLCEKLSQKRPAPSVKNRDREFMNHSIKNNRQYFPRNLRGPRRRRYVASCPSSPGHGKAGFGFTQTGRVGSGFHNSDASSMEELQSAIQSAIAHCKNSMMKNGNTVSNETCDKNVVE